MIPFFYRYEGKIFPGTSDLFYHHTGAHFLEEMVVEEGFIEGKWESTMEDWLRRRFLRPLYGSYKKSPPPLCLWLGDGIGQNAVHALDPLPQGTVVTEYLGQWEERSSAPSAYRWGPIEGRSRRNLGGMIEDGFPNLLPFHLYGENGVPLRILFIAAEEIPAGELLTLHYGLYHDVKVEFHREDHLNKMKDFFITFPLDSLLQRLHTLSTMTRSKLPWKTILELERLTQRVHYLYHTPTAMMALFLEGTIDPALFFHHYDRIENRYYLLGFSPHPRPREERLLSYLNIIRDYFIHTPRRGDEQLRKLLPSVRLRLIVDLFLRKVNQGRDVEESFEETIAADRSYTNGIA